MKHSIRKGYSFGLTSGIITTLGLIVGLHSGTRSKIAVIAGVLTIAIADAFSDALGIHISEEFESEHSQKEIWESTIATFFAKFFFTLTFIIPILFFDLFQAIIISAVWGLANLTIISLHMAKEQKKNPLLIVSEHLLIAIIVVIASHYVGDFIGTRFK